MRLVLVALRNLARNRRRTLLSLLVVAAGSVGILLTAGFIVFSFRGIETALVHGGLAHLEVVRADAVAEGPQRLDRPVAQGLDGWRQLQERIEAQPGVLAAAPNLHLMGMASAGERTASFAGVGVDPERERAMGFELKLRAGEDLPAAAPAEGEDGVLLALGLASSLGVEVGDVVTLLGMSPDGMLNALDVRVVGLYTTGIQELDTRLLKVHLASAQRLLSTDRVADLLVMLEEGADEAAAEARLEALLAGEEPPLAVVGWRERAPFYDQVRDLYLGIFWFLGSVVFVLVVLSTSNTLLMTVMERIRELGTLRAIGTSRGQVAVIVVAEALWLGLFGGVVGGIAGWAAMHAINAMDLRMPPPPGAVDPIDLKLAPVPEAFVGTVLLMMVVLGLAAAAPAWKAVRMRIVEALGHV